MTDRPILVVDGHGIAFRAFFALPELTAADGTPTNAVVGFFNMLGRAVAAQKPRRVVVAFDMKGPTFRHELFPEYKGTRPPTPPEFIPQIPLIKELLVKAGVDVMERAGLEADDLIGAAACQWCTHGPVTVLSSDKDILQVLRPGVKVLRPSRGVSEVDLVDDASFRADWGFEPALMVDYLAMVGDKVDNVPGIPGIGDKTARKLLGIYGPMEEILAHASEQTAGLAKKLTEFGAQAIETRRLTALRCDIDLTEFDSQRSAPDREGFSALLVRLSINSRMAAAFFPEESRPAAIPADRQVVEPSFQVGDGETLILYPEPAESVPLATLLAAPRLALDVERSEAGIRVSLAAPGGQWWSGSWAEVSSSLDGSSRPRLLCGDAKAVFALRDDLTGLWDLRTAHYLLHPDGVAHDLTSLTDLPFGTERTLRIFDLAASLDAQVEAHGMTSLMTELELPMLPVLVRMERAGVELDEAGLADLTVQLEGDLERVAEAIFEEAGDRLNLNSPQQVGHLLFEQLGLPVVKRNQRGYSTDVSVLEELRDRVGDVCKVPALLLDYRELSKMLTGFAAPLAAARGSDGRIHSTFEAQTTGTGRLSSRDPNLQNLPTYSELGARLCRCLIAGEGHVFVSADYSQIELRVLAHLCNEPKLCDIFLSGRDIHTETAAMILGLPANEVTREQRRMAKTVTFGLLYGMSVFGLADRLGTDRTRAQEIMDAYFIAMPGVKNYVERSVREARERGYSVTAFGRIRPLDEITTGRSSDRGHMRRAAINSPIQGTAADITKRAMVAVDRQLAGSDASMVLQVHDSIVCRCPAHEAADLKARLTELMTAAARLNVPLAVEAKIGPTLADL